MRRAPLHLILASKSPRRRELLAEAGYAFSVHPADESVESGVEIDDPVELVRELARRKAADVVSRIVSGELKFLPDETGNGAGQSSLVVLGCDTVAECAGHVLGKPADRDDARRMLQTLRGREHWVLSGLCLWPVGLAELFVDVAVTRLRMDPLTDEQIEDYLASKGWEGKAGAFGYQDRTGWVHVAEGSPSNVVGLPLELLEAMLSRISLG